MYKFFKNLSCLLCLIIIFGGCRKKAFDAYYDRPATLAPPIYQVLQARGNFSMYLQLVDRAGYKATLSASGYWTVFAPNDAAIQKYLTAKNIPIDTLLRGKDSLANKIVKYSLVFNAFQTNHIADFQADKTGWIPNQAFKRRTAYYDGFFTGQTPAGANGVYVSENRNGGYVYGDNNNKYIPYFYSTFMAQAGLTAVDYNYFFPTSTYSGFNVANASVVNKDILAENGVIHEIDQVVTPLPTVEQQLAGNANYSAFRSLYENYMVGYLADVNYTRQYNTVTNKTNTVYVKGYSAALAFALGNESYLKIQADDSQTDGYTLFAPNNTVLNSYLGGLNVVGSLLEFYGSISSMPSSILTDFLNAHMFQTNVWPSKFNSKSNLTGEPPRFDPGLPSGTSATSNIVDKQICSNGLFYGVNKVQQANVFTTVYARAYLDPAYTIMIHLINDSFKSTITSPGNRYTIFMIPDATFRAMGYDWSAAYGNYVSVIAGVTTVGQSPFTTMQKWLYMATVATPNNELNNLSGDGIAETYGGQYIRWHNNTVASCGSIELKKTVNVLSFRDYVNGRVYFLDNLIDESTIAGTGQTIAGELSANAGTATVQGPYYDFYNYLINSSAYNPGALEILGVQIPNNYTVLVPTLAAMKQAVLDGYLPGTYTTVGSVKTFVSFNYKPTVVTDQALVTQFIYYHILSGISVAPDGKKGAAGVNFPTMLKTATGDPINLITFNPGGSFAVGGSGALYFKDVEARQANITAPVLNPLTVPGQTSSYVGNHVLIHQIDNYLRYN